MKADIITIGDEILIGQITDTNSKWIAERLNMSGFEIRQITSVADDSESIKNTLDFVLRYTDLVIITGGLGPTEDDITKQTLAEYFNTDLVLNPDVLEDVKRFVLSKGSVLNDRNIKQAEVPVGCKLIRNNNGTAAGLWFEVKNKVVISVPAVPFEMKEMILTGVLPLLREKFKTPEIVHKNVLTFGIPEARLAELLNDWEKKLPEKINLAYLPSPERIRLRFSAVSNDHINAEKLIDKEILKLQDIIGNAIFGYGEQYLQDIIGDLLKYKGKTVSTAESCTGGNIGRLITSVSGSSEYFKGGIIAYSNEIKINELNVPEDIIESCGAVSKEVVEYMAKGIKKRFKTDYAIAISGIAGPLGGTVEKPVGTTWIAVADSNMLISKCFRFGKRRDINIRISSSKALDMLRKLILGLYID